MISVIVPIYNVGKYIRVCIESLLSQTYSNIQIILVDDGSSDDSSVICDEFAKKDNRIIVIHKENGGLSDARNAGIKRATGEYILFLDGDDWIDPETCEKAIGVLQQNDTDVVLWSYWREYPSGAKKTYLFEDKQIYWDNNSVKKLYRRMVGLVDDELAEPQKIDSIVTAWGKLYKKSAIDGIWFVDTKLIGTEDALFNIQVFSRIKNAFYIPDALSHYRKDNYYSLTHSYKKLLATQWKELYCRIEEHLNKTKASSIFYVALSNRICLGLIGIGLNLAEDELMSIGEKKRELAFILSMPHYRNALKNLSLRDLPLAWKVFFLFAKKGCAVGLYVLLCIINCLRNI